MDSGHILSQSPTDSEDADRDAERLIHASSIDFDMTDFSPASTLVDPRISPPQTRQRPGYSRLSTGSELPTHNEDEEQGDIGAHVDRSQGLGSPSEYDPYRRDSMDTLGPGPTHDRSSTRASVRSIPFSFASSMRRLNQSFPPIHKARTSDLHRGSAVSMRTTQSYADFSPHRNCPTKRHIYLPGGHWLFIALLVLAIFSTLFSGLYLGIALARPEYGRFVSDTGNLSYSNASLLFALFAKLIEMTFITVFVGFMGQVVSRRGFVHGARRGVSLAEMTSRSWVMQPGTMLTHLAAMRYGVPSVLGVMALIAALAGMFYTTASDALVSPQLSPGKWKNTPMEGMVITSFANSSQIESQCATPIRYDPDGYLGGTCMSIELAANSYHNFGQWMTNWDLFLQNGQSSSDLATRPPGFAMYDQNTTVTGAWIERVNMTAVSSQYGRIVNNVTLAMPHSGIVNASKDPHNNVLQPKANDGFGAYTLRASVSSPVTNVLCANMSEDELTPIIFEKFPGYQGILNVTTWQEAIPPVDPSKNFWYNSTVVDDLFGWGPKYGKAPPILPKLPIEWNTVTNGTGDYSHRAGIYILGKGIGPGYTLCAVKSYQTPYCSSEYSGQSSGSTLAAHCEDDSDMLQFIKTDPTAPSGNETVSDDWMEMGQTWSSSISLGTGISDGAASIARALTQLIPTTTSLNPVLPSLAEALAVLAASTLLLSSYNAPFNVTNDIDTRGYMPFKAVLTSQQYASGAVSGYQNIFYIVLLAVFLGNLVVLVWLLFNRGLVTDFSDPQNLFALAINSPPSRMFAGACGGGPEGLQFKTRWFINVDGEHIYLENEQDEGEMVKLKPTGEGDGMPEGKPSPVMESYQRLSKRTSIL